MTILLWLGLLAYSIYGYLTFEPVYRDDLPVDYIIYGVVAIVGLALHFTRKRRFAKRIEKAFRKAKEEE